MVIKFYPRFLLLASIFALSAEAGKLEDFLQNIKTDSKAFSSLKPDDYLSMLLDKEESLPHKFEFVQTLRAKALQKGGLKKMLNDRSPEDILGAMIQVLEDSGFEAEQVLGFMDSISTPAEIKRLQKDTKIKKDLSKFAKDDIKNHVAGEIPESLDRVLQFVASSEIQKQYQEHGLSFGGCMVVGPPGTGKSHTVTAMAKCAGVPYLNVKAADILGKYVGESEKNILDVFEKARELAQASEGGIAVVIFDEIDSYTRNRSLAHQRHEVSLTNSFLQIIGDKKFDKVFVIGITNSVQDIDPAILRSGRLGEIIPLGMPDVAQRKSVISFYANKYKRGFATFSDDDFEALAHMTEGLTPADIAFAFSETLKKSIHARAGRDVVIGVGDLTLLLQTIRHKKIQAPRSKL